MSYEIKVTPRAARETVIANAKKASKRTPHRLYDFRSEPIDLEVIDLEIGVPVYRMANCRTFSEQKNAIARNGLNPLFFENGQESTEAQSEQHRILEKITRRAKSSIANINRVLAEQGQREPILITHTGVVVNGNRRLSAIRDMHGREPTKYPTFSHVKCAVLPSDISANEIEDLEAAFQARPQTKLDYDWISDAQLVRLQFDRRNDFDEVAAILRRKPAEIKNVLSALTEADIYLSDWVKKPGQYSLVVEEGEQLFKDIPKHTGTQDAQLQRASRAIAWSVFENPKRFDGRAYNYNAAFGKLAPKVIDAVIKKLNLDLGEDSGVEEGQFDIAIDETEQVPGYNQFYDALHDDARKDEALDALVDASVTEIERDKGRRQEDAALKSLSQVHSKLAAIDITTASPNTYQSMLKQIQAIEKTLLKLKTKIGKAQDMHTSRKGKTGDRK